MQAISAAPQQPSLAGSATASSCGTLAVQPSAGVTVRALDSSRVPAVTVCFSLLLADVDGPPVL